MDSIIDERPATPVLVATKVQVDVGRTILDATTFSLGRGETVAIVGPSGSGKTTLLACLSGLRLPTSGSVELLGNDLGRMTSSRRSRLRLESIGFVFHHGDLLPELTPLENVMLPMLLRGDEPGEAADRAMALVSDLDVNTSAQTAYLSGGETQRVALARALVTQPAIILADEPTGALDQATRDDVLKLMFGKIAVLNMAAVIVTHDRDVAVHAHRVITLRTPNSVS